MNGPVPPTAWTPAGGVSPRSDNPDRHHALHDRATVETLRRDLSTRFDIVDQEFVIHSSRFIITMVRDTNRLLDEIDPATFALDERLPYWAELWPSAIGLAEEVLSGQWISGMKVLELGCGLGLAGIAAAQAGAHVVLTDYEEDALRFACYNAARNPGLNRRAAGLAVEKLDWRVPGEIGRFDVVLGADLLYERRNFLPLLTVVEKSLVPGGFALFADPDRTVAKEFVELAHATGFRVEAHARTVVHRQGTSSVVSYSIRRAADVPIGGAE